MPYMGNTITLATINRCISHENEKNEILEAGITSLPIVLLKGNYYCHGYDLRALELLPYR